MNALDYTKNYAEDVFTLRTMKNYLSEKAYESLIKTISSRGEIDPEIAGEVADAMKTWSISKGATHFTHWFQPLTGATAEKHDSFIMPERDGGCIMRFSGKELVQGEPDASSFPSGGLRATFEARGYTAWDPTSPAFVKRGPNRATLCIPTVFCAYNGEALDEKTPLLSSMDALSKQISRLAGLFGIETKDHRAYPTLGPEQEYFLIDKKFYLSRPDLLMTGRTLFGKQPSKHQQMEDHYFGAIKPRIMAFMEDLDEELWKLGIPAKTRHNEVSPAQFEIAPVYEEQNLAVDHNMLTMEVLKNVADKHGLVCLLHEKPFAGVNGSGKHNNWSIVGPDGRNWLSPGDNPHENASFITIICAFMKAIDKNAALLRGSVASAGNDHRLGANEAPPAIISIFLGDQLTDIIEQIETGKPKNSKKGTFIKIGVSSLPQFPKDTTDRNRTSPFAFTGNKFEFRAVGSNQNCSLSNTVLNTIVADALDEICTEIETLKDKGDLFTDALQSVLQKIVSQHKRIIFNGDNYTNQWQEEAAKRGLPNITTTPEALKALITPETVAIFEKHGVLSKKELESRYIVYLETYEKIIKLEAKCALNISQRRIIPAVIAYQEQVASSILAVEKAIGIDKTRSIRDLLTQITELLDKVISLTNELLAAFEKGEPLEITAKLAELRVFVDSIEAVTPKDKWPFASYREMLFLV